MKKNTTKKLLVVIFTGIVTAISYSNNDVAIAQTKINLVNKAILKTQLFNDLSVMAKGEIKTDLIGGVSRDCEIN